MHDAITDRRPTRTESPRCVLDNGDRPRPAVVGRVCAAHRQRLADMLDPDQAGQVFTKPGERPTPASIAVLYDGLDAEPVRRSLDSQVSSGAFRSTPPGRLDVMVHRDRRSEVGDDGPYDDRNAELPVLSTLVTIARRLDLRDIHGRPVPLPRLDPPPPQPLCWSKYPDVIGLAGARLWEQHRPRPAAPFRPVRDLCAWLHLRLDALCAADWAADAYADLGRLQGQLRGSAGDAPPRPLGPCWKRVDDDGKLQDGGPWECGQQLYLPPQPLKGMDEPVVLPDDLRCSACGGHYDRGEIVRVGWQRRLQREAS